MGWPLEGSSLSLEGGDECVGVTGQNARQEAIWMNDLDPIRPGRLIREVLQVEGHDGVSTTPFRDVEAREERLAAAHLSGVAGRPTATTRLGGCLVASPSGLGRRD